MINCNPETVSTDYDTSDRLYFEPLTAEDVLEIVATEQSKGTLKGVIVQFGGQTPLKLAAALEDAGVPILGTSPDAIDLAEDRDRFKELIAKLGLQQPDSGIARSPGEARAVADAIGYPVVIRPSYVLGGRAMEIVHDGSEIDRYVARLSATLDRPSELVVSDKRPLLIDRYLTDAVEVDVDCLADGKDTYVCGIMEHIEEAGIHSGDSACSLPPYSLNAATLAELDRQTRELALALKVVGLMNVQFAIKDGVVYMLEVNPRASRTVPFVAKVIGKPIAAIAAEVMAGKRARRLRPQGAEVQARRGQGSRVPVRALPGRRSGARPGDALDRRGHGHRQRLRHGLRQEPARLGPGAAHARHGVHLGEGFRQGPRRRPGARAGRHGLQDHRHAAAPSGTWKPTASPAKLSTRFWKGARTSSTP